MGYTPDTSSMLDRFALINAQLRDASSKGDLALVEICLARGANPLLSSGDGKTALMHAARFGSLDCAQRLLPHSDPKAHDSDGLTPLILAAGYGSLECVDLLLPSSDPKASSCDGITALMAAAIAGDLGCVALLLPVSQVDARDKKGRTAFLIAHLQGSLAAASLIEAWILEQDERGPLDGTISASPHAARRSL